MSTFDLTGISWVRLSFVDVFGTAVTGAAGVGVVRRRADGKQPEDSATFSARGLAG